MQTEAQCTSGKQLRIWLNDSIKLIKCLHHYHILILYTCNTIRTKRQQSQVIYCHFLNIFMYMNYNENQKTASQRLCHYCLNILIVHILLTTSTERMTHRDSNYYFILDCLTDLCTTVKAVDGITENMSFLLEYLYCTCTTYYALNIFIVHVLLTDEESRWQNHRYCVTITWLSYWLIYVLL